MFYIPLEGHAHSTSFYEFFTNFKFGKIRQFLRILKLEVKNSRSIPDWLYGLSDRLPNFLHSLLIVFRLFFVYFKLICSFSVVWQHHPWEGYRMKRYWTDWLVRWRRLSQGNGWRDIEEMVCLMC